MQKFIKIITVYMKYKSNALYLLPVIIIIIIKIYHIYLYNILIAVSFLLNDSVQYSFVVIMIVKYPNFCHCIQ